MRAWLGGAACVREATMRIAIRDEMAAEATMRIAIRDEMAAEAARAAAEAAASAQVRRDDENEAAAAEAAALRERADAAEARATAAEARAAAAEAREAAAEERRPLEIAAHEEASARSRSAAASAASFSSSEIAAHEEAYLELRLRFDEQAATLASVSAARAHEAAASESALISARDAAAHARRREHRGVLRSLVCTSQVHEEHDAMRRAMWMWHWGAAAHSARGEWHRDLCTSRLLLLRRLASAEVDSSLRRLLRRWHSTLVVAAVGGTIERMHAACDVARATRHAHAAALVRASEGRAHEADLTHALATWMRAVVRAERGARDAAEGRLGAMEPQLRDALAEAHATACVLSETDRTRAEGAAELADAHAKELLTAHEALSDERRRGAEQQASHLEESDEVCRAAAEECARMRTLLGDARASAESDHEALAHYCGALLIQSCVRTSILAAAAHAFGRWQTAARAAAPRAVDSRSVSVVARCEPPTPGAEPAIELLDDVEDGSWPGGWRRVGSPTSPKTGWRHRE